MIEPAKKYFPTIYYLNIVSKYMTLKKRKHYKNMHFFSISMINFAKICKSIHYKGFILLFVHLALQYHRSKLNEGINGWNKKREEPQLLEVLLSKSGDGSAIPQHCLR